MSATIYRIVGDNGVYIGSTIKSLKHRLSSHKSNKDTAVKNLINPKIELIEKVPIDVRYYMEQVWINKTNCINVGRAVTKYQDPSILSIDQYRAKHKDPPL
jgi:hypothetical protein